MIFQEDPDVMDLTAFVMELTLSIRIPCHPAGAEKARGNLVKARDPEAYNAGADCRFQWQKGTSESKASRRCFQGWSGL